MYRVRSYVKYALNFMLDPWKRKDSSLSLRWRGLLSLPTYGALGVVHPEVAIDPSGSVILAYTPYHSSVTLVRTEKPGTYYENVCLLRQGDSETSWNEAGYCNPVIRANPSLVWKSGYVADPSLLYVPKHGRWYLWSQPKSAETGEASIALAVSEDGLNWMELDYPVVKSGNSWAKYCRGPAVVFDDRSDHFVMWYDGPHTVGGKYCIGTATSTDGIRWEHSERPISISGLPAEADLWHPSVIHFSGRYWMTVVYGQMDFDKPSYIALLQSDDGLTWSNVGSGALVRPDLWSWKGRRLYRSCLYVHRERVFLLASAFGLLGVPKIGLYEACGLEGNAIEASLGGRIIPSTSK